MSPTSHSHPTASIWKRFWSPTSLLEAVPEGATAGDAEAVRHRNDVWLKTYMDLYILRWGVLWFCSVVLAILAADDGVPAALFVVALVMAIGSAGGLASMIWTYRRASRAIDDRARRARRG
ncbi:hypothetical protein [Variovorax sp. YR216]|uniref:hypothetical protein n=1 Tax=Variovorax sp. YR216 TaxID=1882828 RepID=UPI00089D665A|nr:hypothetical protein [Variovorax sp. YR216]SEB13658.1 hypothetical protein SAMN05444680_10936 [Variovorax sp. YR216]